MKLNATLRAAAMKAAVVVKAAKVEELQRELELPWGRPLPASDHIFYTPKRDDPAAWDAMFEAAWRKRDELLATSQQQQGSVHLNVYTAQDVSNRYGLLL